MILPGGCSPIRSGHMQPPHQMCSVAGSSGLRHLQQPAVQASKQCTSSASACAAVACGGGGPPPKQQKCSFLTSKLCLASVESSTAVACGAVCPAGPAVWTSSWQDGGPNRQIFVVQLQPALYALMGIAETRLLFVLLLCTCRCLLVLFR
jgi:hypothetical protein